jgi:hypothetical protein
LKKKLKGQKGNQKNKDQIKKKKHHKLGLNDEIENHQNLDKKAKEKNRN